MSYNSFFTKQVGQPSRSVEQLVQGQETSDGAGVRLTRLLGHRLQQRLDPYLMLDVFCSEDSCDYIGGFPDHPHRGFEAVTYMVAGRMRHRDSAGNEGLLQNGGVQWMLAGRGLIHSELPEQDNGLMQGFQLWLNLPAKDKMTAPAYQDIPAESIPAFISPAGVRVRVIASTAQGINGVRGAVVRPVTEPIYLDLDLPANSCLDIPIPCAHNAFLYTYRGEILVGTDEHARIVPDKTLAILSNSPQAQSVSLSAKEPSRVLLIAGKPLNESIVQHGPFVMNTQEQIEQALIDYRLGLFKTGVIQAL